MKVFLMGGTGLLGLEAAKVLLSRGHEVIADALPPLPVGAEIPNEMKLTLTDTNKRGDEELKGLLKGVDCFIFAAGIDERVECPAPVYDWYEKYNVKPVRRLLGIAKEVGVKKAVVLGSYFAMLVHPEYGYNQKLPKGLLEKNHYLRARMAQEEEVKKLCDDSFDAAVLELPYIFGTQPGRQPVWTILIEQIKGMDGLPWTLYPKGGTAIVTVRQVGQAIAGAAEKLGSELKGFNHLPIGMVNYTWKQFLPVVYEARGMGKRKVKGIPAFVMKMGMGGVIKEYKKKGIQPGLDPYYLPYIMNLNIFIDDKIARSLGVEEDDIDAAIADSVKVSVACYNGEVELLQMKGENFDENK